MKQTLAPITHFERNEAGRLVPVRAAYWGEEVLPADAPAKQEPLLMVCTLDCNPFLDTCPAGCPLECR